MGLLLSWWQSPEMISKIVTVVSTLIVLMSGLGLMLGIRLDGLKKNAAFKKDQEVYTLKEELDSESHKLIDTKDKLDKVHEELNATSEKLVASESKLEEVSEIAKKAATGVVSTYDFNGVKRDNGPGICNAFAGEELGVFQRLIALDKEKKSEEIFLLCKEQIKKTPEWSTLYLFIGLANINTGNKNDAKTNLEYFIKNSPKTPDYQDAINQAQKLILELNSN